MIISSAKDYCEGKGGYLVEYQNKNEENILFNFLKNEYNNRITNFWIGLRDYDTQGHFRWESGQKV